MFYDSLVTHKNANAYSMIYNWQQAIIIIAVTHKCNIFSHIHICSNFVVCICPNLWSINPKIIFLGFEQLLLLLDICLNKAKPPFSVRNSAKLKAKVVFLTFNIGQYLV